MHVVKPVRLKRSRAKGSRLLSPNGLPIVCVSRPSKWGNPFVAVRKSLRGVACDARQSRLASVAEFKRELLDASTKPRLTFTVNDVRRELRGKNLACWCPLDEPCHADVLLEIANA
jgi:hypothetical protein